MPALLQVVTHDALNVVRMLTRVRQLRADLRNTPGLLAGRLFLGFGTQPRLGFYPAPRRWAMLCAFDSAEALSQFESSPLSRAVTDDAREEWRVTLRPAKPVRGSWYGWHPSALEIEPLEPAEPVGVLTYAVLRRRYTPWFFWNNRLIVQELCREPGLVSLLGISDSPMTIATFSIWRSQRDIGRFAYGGGTAHRAVVRPALDLPTLDKTFFGRFRLTDSVGTIDGRDPVSADCV